jgi:hypothetical protein
LQNEPGRRSARFSSACDPVRSRNEQNISALPLTKPQ